jgi:hypothetical protein
MGLVLGWQTAVSPKCLQLTSLELRRSSAAVQKDPEGIADSTALMHLSFCGQAQDDGVLCGLSISHLVLHKDHFPSLATMLRLQPLCSGDSI